MKTFKPLFVAILAAFCFTTATGFAAYDDYLVATTPLKSVRTTAILTNSDVAGTTFTASDLGTDYQKLVAIGVYVDFTLGSSTNGIFTVAGAKTGNPATTAYYKATVYSQTYTASGAYYFEIPKDQTGGAEYFTVFSRCTGTTTSSDAVIGVKAIYGK